MTAIQTKLAALLAKRGQDYFTEFDDYNTELADKVDGVGAGLVATSSTSVTVGTGSKSFTIQTDKNFSAGGYVTAYVTADPTITMAGVVASYNADTGAISITVPTGGTTGSGTYSAWTITTSGARGPEGQPGADGDVGGPVSSTDNAWVRFNGTDGANIQNGTWVEDDSGNVTAGGSIDGAANEVYGFVARENNIGSTGSNVTLDADAYSVWYFEPTGNIDVDVTNVPNIGNGAVVGYAVITGGGDHTLTLKCEGATGGALTPGGVGLTLSTGTDRDVVAIIKTGTDEVMFKVAGAAIS